MGPGKGRRGGLGERCARVALIQLPKAGGMVPAVCTGGGGGPDSFPVTSGEGGVEARPPSRPRVVPGSRGNSHLQPPA